MQTGEFTRKCLAHIRVNMASRATILFLCSISTALAPFIALASQPSSYAHSSATTSAAVVFTDWRQQAQTYNTAMQQIAQVSNLPLRNQSDLARALGTLQKNGPMIDQGRVSAAIKTAADNVSFQSTVKSALSRKCGGTRSVETMVSCISNFINQVSKDRASFGDAGGAIALSAIQTRFKNDSDALKRLGTNMNTAIKNLRPANAKSLPPARREQIAAVKTHHAVRRDMDLNSASVLINNTPNPVQTGIIEIPVAIAMAVCATGGVLTGGAGWAACAAGAVIIAVTVIAVAWAALKSDDFFVGKARPVFRTNPDTGEQVQTEEIKTDFEVCKERADGSRENCLTAAGNNFWLTAGCWTVWSLRMADCLLLPQ